MSGPLKATLSFTTLPKNNSPVSLRDKLCRLRTSQRFNLSYDWLSLLVSACVDTTFRLNIPETIFCEEKDSVVLLFTDSEGMVRTRASKRALDEFLFLCQSEQSKVDNSNPNGLFAPSFVTFKGDKVVETVQAKENLKWQAGGDVCRVQRFVPNKGFTPNKLVVWWRREKAMKAYSVVSKVSPITKSIRGRMGLQNPAERLDPCPADNEFAYIASLRFLDNCDVRRETRLPEELTHIASLLRSLLSQYVLSPMQQVEELLFSVTFSLDQKCFFLSSSKARVSQIVPDSARFTSRSFRRASSTKFSDLLSSLQKVKEISTLPRLFPKEKAIYRPVLPSIRCESAQPPDPASALISRYLTSIAGSMDRIFQQSRARKQEAALLLHKVKILGYPAWFLPNVIHLFYEKVSEEPKLSRFFRGNERMLEHIKGSMHQVFTRGSYQSHIKAIHKHLEIGEEEFALYLRAFGWAMSEEGAHSADKHKALAYLTSFRESVVGDKAETTCEKQA